MKILSKNKFVYSDYEIKETLEAGVVLAWHEVKSAKTWHINITDAFVKIDNDKQAYIINMDIPLYSKTSPDLAPNYEQKQRRKLLLKKREIQRLWERTHKTWLVLVPINIYINKSWIIKITLWLGKLKKKIEKKQAIKDRDIARQADKEIKRLGY